KRDTFDNLSEKLEDTEVLVEMASEEETSEYDEEILNSLEKIEKEMEEFKIETLLNGEYDGNNAILAINAGAGGKEAKDWANMLLRLYSRWLERHGVAYEVEDDKH